MRSNALGVNHSFRACALTAALVFGTPLTALAEEPAPSASDTALARTLGSEGVQLAEAGNCAAAIEKLERAEKLYHAPTILGRLGECQVSVGKIVAGTENLQRVVRESLPPRAPKAFVDAQARAQKVLDGALPKLAKLKIHVDAPPGVNVTVSQDGEPVSSATLDLDRPADPGVHTVEATAPGFRAARGETTLAEGATGAVSLRLEPDPSVGATGAAGPPASAGQAPPLGPGGAPSPNAPADGSAYPGATAAAPSGAETSGGSNLPAYLLLGTGVVGVAVGSIFGGRVLSKKSSLDGVCKPDKAHCPASAQGDIDSMRTSATISTVGFAVGGVALGAGVIMLIVSKSSSSSGDAKTAPARATLTPFVGPTSFGLSGSF
ncbi:MAG TPA: hypothetical protein VK550_21700 [Polyangiaceae bacterium]|nr:hypothetical protein [Polyangiaceae bacterium]